MFKRRLPNESLERLDSPPRTGRKKMLAREGAGTPAFDAARRARRIVAAEQSRLPGIAWPTLALFAAAALAFTATVYYVVTGSLPLWAGTLINSGVVYVMYTPLHEAVHGLILRGSKRRRAINDWIGRIAGMTALVAFDAFRMLHLDHHRYVNEPTRDPDYWLPKSSVWFAPINVFAGFYHTYVETARLARITGDTRGLKASKIRWALVLAGFVAALATGWTLEFLLLWIVPGILGLSAITFVFGWLPHRALLLATPDSIRLDSTAQPWRSLWNVASIAQSHHLFHHAFPRLPFFRLVAVYRIVADDMATADLAIWNATPDVSTLNEPGVREQPMAA